MTVLSIDHNRVTMNRVLTLAQFSFTLFSFMKLPIQHFRWKHTNRVHANRHTPCFISGLYQYIEQLQRLWNLKFRIALPPPFFAPLLLSRWENENIPHSHSSTSIVRRKNIRPVGFTINVAPPPRPPYILWILTRHNIATSVFSVKSYLDVTAGSLSITLGTLLEEPLYLSKSHFATLVVISFVAVPRWILHEIVDFT
jgi:hypothetical protein